MSISTDLLPGAGGLPADPTDRLRLAVAGYLARFQGASRRHTDSDLRTYLTWCQQNNLDPLAAGRAHVELYLRWMQEERHFKPSTVSRRASVVAGFYRTCVADGVLGHSPAEHVRRPAVPTESQTLGLTHLQLEALLSAARDSANPHDFALLCMLGLLGLRIFEATGADVEDLREEHGHRVLKVRGKGGKVVLVPLPPAVEQAAAGRTAGPILRNRAGRRMDRHAATRRLHRLAAATRMRMPPLHPHMLRHFVSALFPCGDSRCAARREGQAPACPECCPRGVVEAPRSRAAEGRRVAIAKQPLTVEGRPRTLRGAPRIATRTHLHTVSAGTSHSFVTTMLDAGVDLRDVQIAARHADPRTTMRYDRARTTLDRHPNYVLAAYMAAGT